MSDDDWSFIFDSCYEMTAAEIGRALGRSRSTIQKFYLKHGITAYKRAPQGCTHRRSNDLNKSNTLIKNVPSD